MTDTHALDTVRLILSARLRVSTWGVNLESQALVAMDRTHRDWGAEAWLTTVAIFASPDEHPVEAAQRLTKYLLAYQETHGQMPSLDAVQKHSAERHLKEHR